MASIQDVSSARTSPLNLRCDQTATVGNSPLVLLGVCVCVICSLPLLSVSFIALTILT